MSASAFPKSVDGMIELLTSRGYLAERSLATVTYLSLRMGRPLFLEGEAGVGKTEIAKVLSAALGRKLIRLQCYEGLDVASAVYEWNSAAQMIAIRLAEAAGDTDREQLSSDIFADRYLIKRPLLQALEPDVAGAPAHHDDLAGIGPLEEPREVEERRLAGARGGDERDGFAGMELEVGAGKHGQGRAFALPVVPFDGDEAETAHGGHWHAQVLSTPRAVALATPLKASAVDGARVKRSRAPTTR